MKRRNTLALTIVAALALIAQTTPVDAGLIREWKFNGDLTETQIADNAADNGGIGYGTDRDGNANSALSVNGSSYAEVSGGGGLNNLQTGSISMWVQWNGTQDDGFAGTNGAVTSRQLNGSVSQQIIGLTTNDPSTAVINWKPYGPFAGDTAIVGTTVVGDGSWRHVVITYTDGEHRLYVDGAQEGTLSATSGTIVDDAGIPLGIGAWYGDGSAFSTSLIDTVRIYDHVLTAGEVTSLFGEDADATSSIIPTPAALPAGLALLVVGAMRRRRR